MNKKRKKIFVSVSIFICTVLCCGFAFIPRPIPVPPPEFDQTGCITPCWYGLQIGISTKQDIRNILSTFSSDITKIKISEGEYQSEIQYIEIIFLDKSYRYNHNGPAPEVSFIFDNDNDEIVDYIYINNMILMKQAFDIFGEPDYALVYSYEFLPNFWKKDLHLYYKNYGVGIACFEGTTYTVSERPPCFDSSEISLSYFNSENFLKELEDQFGDAELALQYIRPYQGLDADYPILEGK